MKKILAIFMLLLTCSACGTVGGAISGAGSDIQKAGEWLKKK
jgi:predicted small secreted protein